MGTGYGVERLEKAFDRERKATPGEFTQWEKDLAYTAQKLLEETVLRIAETYTWMEETSNLAVAGGVALNCKLNKRLRESDAVDDFFVQPVAHDAGLALGAGMLERPPSDVPEMETVSYGPEYDASEIRSLYRHEQDPLRRAGRTRGVCRRTAGRRRPGRLVHRPSRTRPAGARQPEHSGGSADGRVP